MFVWACVCMYLCMCVCICLCGCVYYHFDIQVRDEIFLVFKTLWMLFNKDNLWPKLAVWLVTSLKCVLPNYLWRLLGTFNLPMCMNVTIKQQQDSQHEHLYLGLFCICCMFQYNNNVLSFPKAVTLNSLLEFNVFHLEFKVFHHAFHLITYKYAYNWW